MFSTVERTLTAIRATMGEERLESLLLLQSARACLPKTVDVVNVFAAKARRAQFVL
jgi:hypothetical protein